MNGNEIVVLSAKSRGGPGKMLTFDETARAIELLAGHAVHDETLEGRSADKKVYAILQHI